MGDKKDELWREVVSRIAMSLLSLMLLGAAAGLFYVGWAAREGSGGLAVLAISLGVGLTGTGMFLLKRVILPGSAEERNPTDAAWYWRLLSYTSKFLRRWDLT